MARSSPTIIVIDALDEARLAALGCRLGEVLRPGDLVGLSGELGAGKTSLARAILAGAGHQGDVPSPSFTLVETYGPPGVSLPVWHVDLYRLEDPAEAQALALDEALAEAALLVEWPERLGAGWPAPDALALRLDGAGEPRRRLTSIVPAAWDGRWPPGS